MLFRKRTRLVSLVDEFADVIRSRSRGTAKSWKTDVNRLMSGAELLGTAFIELVEPKHVAGVLSALEKKGLKPKTTNHYREILHRCFQYGIDEKGIRFKVTGDINPASRVRRRREPALEITYLTPDETETLLEILTGYPQLRAMVAVYIYAGLRRAEALWLTRQDVDMRRGLIRVAAKTIGGASWQPKTAQNRSVPISKRLRKELSRWQPPKGSIWFFPSPEGKRWDEDNFSRALRRAQEGAGARWRCLDFRHSFGTALAKRGVSLYKISKLLGNSPEVCRRHYAHLVAAELKEEVEFDAVERTAEEPEAVQARGTADAKPDALGPAGGRAEAGRELHQGHATAQDPGVPPAAGEGGDEPSVSSAGAEALESPLRAEAPTRLLAGLDKAQLSRVSEGFRRGLERALSDKQAILRAIANVQHRGR